MEVIFSIAVLIFSVVIHEISHGYAAYFLGDPTAKYAGRLSINPWKHLEFIGSFLVPLITSLGGFAFGWAKPVPFNPYNLRAKRWGEAIVAVSGPLSNLFIALVFSLVLRFVDDASLNEATVYMLSMIILVNISLAVFNLVPIPPLDGSRILGSILPYQLRYIQDKLEQNAFILILIFVFFIWDFVAPVVPWLFKIFTGVALG